MNFNLREVGTEMPRDVKAFLLSKKSEAKDEEISRQWQEMEELYSRRLIY